MGDFSQAEKLQCTWFPWFPGFLFKAGGLELILETMIEVVELRPPVLEAMNPALDLMISLGIVVKHLLHRRSILRYLSHLIGTRW